MSYVVTVNLTREPKASRIQLLFGSLIAIPDTIVLLFKSILSSIYTMIGWLSIVFTGKYPQNMWEFSKGVAVDSAKLNAYLWNLTSKKGKESALQVELAYPAEFSRVKALFGFFFIIPHMFLAFFKAIGFMFVMSIASLAIFFTGSYPEGLWNFSYSFFRFTTRLSFYTNYLTPEVPPTSGKAD